MFRSRKHTKSYKPEAYIENLRKGKIKCPFCDLKEQRIVRETRNMYVIDNLYPYDYWEEGVTVADHLMIIPKRHIISFRNFNADENSDFLKLISEYDAKGYNIYARTVKNQKKSVDHQHTHLIKIKGETANIYFYLRRPYLIFRK